MNTLEETSDYIFRKTRDTKLSRFTEGDIQLVLYLSNNFIDDYYRQTYSWEAPAIGSDMNDYIIRECASNGLQINEEEIEEILELESEINQDVINSMTPEDYKTYCELPEEEMQKKYKISKWSEWNDAIDEAIDDYYCEFGQLPNYLSANEHTFSQIDFMVNIMPDAKQNVFRYDELSGDDVPLTSGEEISITSYASADCKIEFMVDDEIKDKYFVLSFTYDDDDDDNDFNDNDTVIDPDPIEKLSLVM